MKRQRVQPRYRRKSLWRRIVTPRRIAVLGVLAAIGLAVFAFFYVKYSRVLDAKLRGDILVRTSGIYAQPKRIKPGQNFSLAELRRYLTGLGYAEGEKGAEGRGHYTIEGKSITIAPGDDAVVDKARIFPALTISYTADGGQISKILDAVTKKPLQSAQLEPDLLTTVSNTEREKRKIVRFEDLPKHLVDAIVAIEDRRFYEHSGVDYRGLARAVWTNVTNRELTQGGSTVTQQLVKNMFLTPERTYKRKLQEAFIAIVLETRLSKPEIMQLYCNEIFLGQQGAYSINGMGEAAKAYFDKDVSQLDIPESALLAGIIRGPSLYSPYANPDKALERRNQVLDAMVEMQFVTPEAAEQYKRRDLGVRERRILANADAPYFVDYLQRELERAFPGTDLSRQALRIYSTIDMDLQQAAERAVRENLANLDKIYASRKKDAVPPGTLQAALVALNPKTGEIYAMVGGRDYEKSQLNRAADAKRQPGSVFKPIVYAAALESAYGGAGLPTAITPATKFLDAPEKFLTQTGEVYEPDNYGKSYTNRELPLREGLVNSLNVITVRVAEKVGLFQVQQTATKLGLPKPPPYLATALGTTEATPLEVAGAYTAFAELGDRVAPTGIARVTDESGTTVRALRPDPIPAIHPQTAYIITDFLKDVINRGTAAGARARGFNALAAGKTGTSRDGWFAGYTPNLVCVVYVGFDDGSQLGLEGSKSALPIWTDFVKTALRLRPELGGDTFPKPDAGVVEVEIDPDTGQLATPNCPKHHVEIFVEGTQPTESSEEHETGAMEDAGGVYSRPPWEQPPGSPPGAPPNERPPAERPPPPPQPAPDGETRSDRPRRARPPEAQPPN
jgi:penicillin-binding protein 1B